MREADEVAAKPLGQPFDRLDPSAQRVAQHKHLSRNNVAKEPGRPSTAGQRAADAAAR
jgi:hypothetical protein